MSGHSKWSQIKRQKGATDAAKSRTFSRYSRLITIEAKKAAGNLSAPSLVSAIERAQAVNMPKDSIGRAIAKGSSKEASDLEQVTYEFYGPGGIAIIADALTDNKNRTTQEMKHLLTKNGYELGVQGSAAWAFTRHPDGSFSANEPLMEVAGDDETKLSALFDLIDEQEDVQKIYSNARGYEDTGD